MMWILVSAYVCLCTLLCTALIATVLESELQIWSLRASASMIQMVVFFPLAKAGAAHRIYYTFLHDIGNMQELRRTLHLKDWEEPSRPSPTPHVKTAWEEPSRPSPAPPLLSPRPPTPAETPPSLRQLGKSDEEVFASRRSKFLSSATLETQWSLYIVYYTILYYTILYYTILYYIILYYALLYYTILYYTIL